MHVNTILSSASCDVVGYRYTPIVNEDIDLLSHLFKWNIMHRDSKSHDDRDSESLYLKGKVM